VVLRWWLWISDLSYIEVLLQGLNELLWSSASQSLDDTVVVKYVKLVVGVEDGKEEVKVFFASHTLTSTLPA
jgi:hypothetical protein